MWRVRAVIPCYNRRRDAELLLSDLAGVDLGGRIELTALLVDNASDQPLAGLSVPPGLSVEHLRLESNTGGSGGFNAGMSRLLSRGIPGDRSELLWLLDSDARAEAGTLLPLVKALEADGSLAAAGSAIADPVTGATFEIGGRINPRGGDFEPVSTSSAGAEPIPVPYVAACSALVRRTAVEETGLFPDTFLNGDDVQWFLQMQRRTGLGVAAVPSSRAIHPRFDRFQSWARYYVARNCLGPIDAAGMGRIVRLRRALTEVGRAMIQTMMGRDDLAELHLMGLGDAVGGRLTGARPDVMRPPLCRSMHPLKELGRELGARFGARASAVTVRVHPDLGPQELAPIVAEQLMLAGLSPSPGSGRDMLAWGRSGVIRWLAAMVRALIGPGCDVAIVPARGHPALWLAGRISVQVAAAGYTIHEYPRLGGVRLGLASVALGVRGAAVALRAAMRPPGYFAPAFPPVPCRTAPAPGSQRASLGVVVLSYNRWPALERTLRCVQAELAGAQIIVADNGSTDGTPERLKEAFPGVELLALGENVGVEAFNRAVRRTSAQIVLILDDDAHPQAGVIDAALDLLARRPDLGAVALHPRHPDTKASEWPFGEGSRPRDNWPVMGCGNLVRRQAWERVGGYEESFFLYRNDTDLAMKLLAAGFGVHFNPAWVVWHDSPATTSKSPLWFDLATRNWVWVCRRHGRGVTGIAGAIFGWLWAHKLAGLDAVRHWNALRGFVRGWATRPPGLPQGLLRDGAPMRRLLRQRVRKRID